MNNALKIFKKDFPQLVVIVISAIFAYAFFNPDPGNKVFDSALLIDIGFNSIITIFVLLLLTYFSQQKIAKTLYCELTYPLWYWGIFSSMLVTILIAGIVPFYHVGTLLINKKRGAIGRGGSEVTRVEAAAISGVAVTIGLLAAIIFVEFKTISFAATLFAAWNLIPLPKTNGWHSVNWHPLMGVFNGILAILLIILYVFSELNFILIFIAIIYLPYQWFYVYVLARRTGY